MMVLMVYKKFWFLSEKANIMQQALMLTECQNEQIELMHIVILFSFFNNDFNYFLGAFLIKINLR